MLNNDQALNTNSSPAHAPVHPGELQQGNIVELSPLAAVNLEAPERFRAIEKIIEMLVNREQRSVGIAAARELDSVTRGELISQLAKRMEPSANNFRFAVSYPEKSIAEVIPVLKEFGREGVKELLADLPFARDGSAKLYFEIRSRFGTNPYPRYVGEALADTEYRKEVIQTVCEGRDPIERTKLGMVLFAAFARDIIPQSSITEFDRVFLSSVLADKTPVYDGSDLTISDHVRKMLTYAPTRGQAVTSAFGNPIYPEPAVRANALNLYRQFKPHWPLEGIYHRALQLVGW